MYNAYAYGRLTDGDRKISDLRTSNVTRAAIFSINTSRRHPVTPLTH